MAANLVQDTEQVNIHSMIEHSPPQRGQTKAELARKEKRQILEAQKLLCDYLHELEEIEFVSGVIIGSHPEERQGYMWSILTEDYSPALARRAEVANFSSISAAFQMRIAAFFPLRMSTVGPSQYDRLLAECESENMDMQIIGF